MRLVEISPAIPPALARLTELAGNLSYSWHRPTRALFEDLDRTLWRQSHANPRLLLRCVSQESLDAAAVDPDYMARYHAALEAYDSYQAKAAEENAAAAAVNRALRCCPVRSDQKRRLTVHGLPPTGKRTRSGSGGSGTGRTSLGAMGPTGPRRRE